MSQQYKSLLYESVFTLINNDDMTAVIVSRFRNMSMKFVWVVIIEVFIILFYHWIFYERDAWKRDIIVNLDIL